jgi:putative membrane protein
MSFLGAVSVTVLGTLVGGLFSLLPALHIYNVAGIFLLAVLRFDPQIAPVYIALTLLSALVAYGFLNTIPSVFLGVPDESTAFMVLPASKCLLQGRGYEASMLTGIGSLGGILLMAATAPFALSFIPVLRQLLGPHMGWILLSIGSYMLISEWPIGTDRPKNKLQRLWDSWDRLFFGILTFTLSAILGMVILNRTLVPSEMAFQGVMPAFVGLFAIPWIIQNLLSRHEPPPQFVPQSLDINLDIFARAMASGGLGGMFSAIFPVVTAGVGSLLAGHATAQHDDRVFLISYGAAKVIYYAGAFLFFFAPGMNLTRGGMAWMIGPFYQASAAGEYWMALGCLLLSGALSLLLLDVTSLATVRLVEKMDPRTLSWISLVICLFIVGGLTGSYGLLVCFTGAGIGSIPIFFNCRRSHCMAVLIVPIGLAMCGYQEVILNVLGL